MAIMQDAPLYRTSFEKKTHHSVTKENPAWDAS